MSYIKSDDFKGDFWVKTQLLDFPFQSDSTSLLWECTYGESFRQLRSNTTSLNAASIDD